MILFEKPVVQNSNLNNIEDESDEYHNLPENDDDLENSDRGFIYLPSLNLNYWNNLNLSNLSTNLNLNLRNTALWKIYENGVENLSKTTGFMINRGKPDSLDLLEELSDTLDLQDIFISCSKKGIKDPEEKYIQLIKPKIELVDTSGGDRKDQNSILGEDSDDEEEEKVIEDDTVVLSEEFWSSIFATTEGHSDGSVNLPVPEGMIKAPINPFYHRTKFTIYDFIKVAIGSVILLPLRALGMMASLLVAFALASIATTGITFEELQSKPITGWRKNTRWVIANIVMRVLFFCCGFHWVKKKGKQATAKEAPILVVAPHSSYFDAFPLILMGAPSVVAKSSVRKVPFFGKLVDLTQAVYVSRDMALSRHNTVQQISNRAKSGEDWPQIFIYPEGTCSNRSCLISFKSGAFLPGVPIQPVLIKYPNRFDSITWTFDGPPVYKTWWWTMSQLHNYCELEFLPVYTPSEEEKKDATLFANNVRQVMSEAMCVPVNDYTFEDGLAMCKINTEQLLAKLKDISGLRNTLKLSSLMELSIMQTMLSSGTNAWWVTLEEFTLILNLIESEPKLVEKLFKLFHSSEEGRIDIREYLVYACLINPNVRVDRVMPAVFLMYAEGRKRMSMDGFTQFMQCMFQMPPEEAHTLFAADMPQGTMDLDKFGKKLRKRLEYIRLYALEANNLLSVYPPRDREINASKHHLHIHTHSNSNSKSKFE